MSTTSGKPPYQVPGDGDPTPGLALFLAAYQEDDNEWWRLACGHHQNLFEDAVDARDTLAERIARTLGTLTAWGCDDDCASGDCRICVIKASLLGKDSCLVTGAAHLTDCACRPGAWCRLSLEL